MKISFYFDEMLKRPLADQLNKRGYTVVLANDIGMTEATKREMVLVTLDRAFAGLAAKETEHAGLICWTREDQPIGVMLRVLVEFAEQHTTEQAAGRVFWFK